MKFQPQNSLEISLLKASTDPAHRPQFYRDFVKSDVFIIQEGPPPERSGTTVLNENYQLQIRNIDWNGKPVIPIFSSLVRLQANLQYEVGYIALNALKFMEITQGSDLLLNPGSDYGKEFTKEEIASILDGSIWQPSESFVAKKDTQIMIGKPANYPNDLVEALSRLFKKTKEVKRAFVAHFFNPEQDEKPHTLIAIEVNGNWKSIVASAGMVARDVPSPDPPVDFIQITGKEGLADYFLRECKPFYERKLFGIF
jgi:hypothetical protein